MNPTKSNISNLFEDNLAGAVISPNKLYRYALWRTWNTELPVINFIGINPSTAQVIRNDRTISRLIKFSKDWGYGSFFITNLFALRDKSPSALLKYPELSVGAKNDEYLMDVNQKCKNIVFMWGDNGTLFDRDKQVIKMFPEAMCFGKTKKGNPTHPLYLKKSTTLMPFSQTIL